VNEQEVLLATTDALNRGDLSRCAELFDPECVLHPIRAPMTGDYHGYDGLVRFLADNKETFEVFEIGFDEFQLLDDGRLFAAGHVRIRGLGSKVDTVVETAGYATFRDGRVSGWNDYGDRTAALAALGLDDPRKRY
jgi:ketosteroid isomerase-like protein